MNIVIKNENYKIIDTLNIDIIKTLNGSFSKEEISKELVNFYYNKVVIDITAIRNYYDTESIIDFLSFFAKEKIILLLNNSELVNSPSYLSVLVNNGYYNFTRNAAGINYLMENPNNRNNVIEYTKVKEEAKEISREEKVEQKQVENISNSIIEKNNSNQRIIGIQNLTPHAGATTLMYMMIKQLKLNYKVKGIEMMKQDSIYFRDSDISMCTSIDDVKSKIKLFSGVEVIFIDLNGMDDEGICTESLALIEPGTIRLNKLVKSDPTLYEKLKNKKVVLNRSSIKEDEISGFEYETKFKVFANISNFNERKERIQIIDNLLVKLGFNKQGTNNKGLFGLFK